MSIKYANNCRLDYNVENVAFDENTQQFIKYTALMPLHKLSIVVTLYTLLYGTGNCCLNFELTSIVWQLSDGIN